MPSNVGTGFPYLVVQFEEKLNLSIWKCRVSTSTLIFVLHRGSHVVTELVTSHMDMLKTNSVKKYLTRKQQPQQKKGSALFVKLPQHSAARRRWPVDKSTLCPTTAACTADMCH